jgi:tetratricopeptide (TPR) repeat protein
MADDYKEVLESANAALQEQDFDRAIVRCNRAISLDRDQPGAYISRAWAFIEKRDYDKGIEDCTKALSLQPDKENESKAYSNRASAYVRKKEYEKAIKDCRKAIQLNPRNYIPHNELAWILATCPNDKLRDGKKAWEHAKLAYDLEPGDANVLDNVAAAYAECGDFDQAISWQEAALEATNKSSAKEDIEKRMRQRLELYKKKMPYRDK